MKLDTSRPSMVRALARRFEGWPAAAVLVVLIVAAFSPTFQADFVNWDDQLHISQNPRVTEPDGFLRSWYDTESPGFYPITYTTFYLEWWALDGAPWLFHLDNVLLHAANALLLAALVRRLGLPESSAWLVAALWALHPIGVASVAWVTERKNVLYTFFWMCSLLLHLSSVDGWMKVADSGQEQQGAPPNRSGPWPPYLLSVGLFGLALLSKGAAMTLPAAAVLLGWMRGSLPYRRFWLSLIPHLLMALGGGLALTHAVPAEAGAPELGSRFLLATRALLFYVKTFLWPGELLPIYPRWTVSTAALREYVPVGVLVVAAMFAVAMRGRLPRVFWLGTGLFLSNVILVVGVVWFTYLRHSWVADHLAYLPSVGLALGAVAAVHEIGRLARLPPSVPIAGLALWCAALGVATWHQAGVWRNSETLWNYTLTRNPDCSTCHANLGFLLAERGEIEVAIVHYGKALRLRPEVKTAVNFGNARMAQGQLGEALTLYQLAMRLDPTHVGAAYNFANALHKQGKIEEAIAGYRSVLRLAPRSTDAHNNLGVALLSAGRVDEARAEFEETLRLDPDDVEAELNLGVIASGNQRWSAAVAHYERALRRQAEDPRYADGHYKLGEALAEQGNVEKAMSHFEAANRLAGGDADSLERLAALLTERGEVRKAGDRLAEAVRIAPDNPALHYRFAEVLGVLGDKGRAMAHLRKAVELAPEEASLANHLAWVLATDPEARWRDGKTAVRLAEEACRLTGGSDADYLDTLAAAYAEAGRFADAVHTERRAIGLAEGDPEIGDIFRRRLSLYEHGKPYRDPGEAGQE